MRLKCALIAMFLSGCATGVQKVEDNSQAAFVSELSNASIRMQQALDTLQTYGNSTDRVRVDRVGVAPAELKRSLDAYEYVGDAAVVVRDLAREAGYNFKIIGDPPIEPIIVSVNWYDVEVIEGLRDVGARVGNRATVAVDVNAAQVELRYDR